MRILIQRVSEASVSINQQVAAQINAGLLVFLGVEHEDGQDDIVWLVEKLLKLRIFDDEKGVMNLSVSDVSAQIMVISQFTLHASTRKGARPSYIHAARPELAIPLYEKFISLIKEKSGQNPATGEFGAHMQIGLINDGPVTIWIDSKRRD